MSKLSPKSAFDVVSTMVLIGIAGAVLWRMPPAKSLPEKQEPIADVSKEGLIAADSSLASLGTSSARVVVFEYSDFECPYCAQFARTTFKELEREVIEPGIVKYIPRAFPLSAIHPKAEWAAERAECAARQNMYWRLRSAFFSDPKQMSDTVWEAGAVDGLDHGRMHECLRAGVSDAVLREAEEGRRLGVRSTPTFLIGTRISDNRVSIAYRVTGAAPIETFREVIRAVTRKQG